MARVFGISQPDFASGLTDITGQTTIPRQRAEIELLYGAKASYLGGSLTGTNRLESVLRFPTTQKTPFIVTEGYYDPTGADFSKPFLCPHLADFGIDGQWGQFSDTNPLPYRCDGIRIKSGLAQIDRLRLFNIPGYSIVFDDGGNQNLEAFQTYFDGVLARISNVELSSCWGGVVVNQTDCVVENLDAKGIIGSGLTLNGSSAYVRGGHIFGCQAPACTINAPAIVENVYWEAAPIGCLVDTGADGTKITGLQTSPITGGTCWQRGLKINCNSVTVLNLNGAVFTPTSQHTDCAGIEITGGVQHVIQGEQTILGDGGHTPWALLMAGSLSKVALKGGWNTTIAGGGFCKVTTAITGTELDLRGTFSNGGTVLDLSASGLNSTAGKGNVFVVNCNGNATPIKYPGGGGTTFNLAAGNRVFLNGVETYKNGLGDTYIDGAKQ